MAATRLSLAAGFGQGRYRQQARSHGEPSSAAHCPPLLSGSEAPPQNPGSGHGSGALPVGAALAARRLSLAAGFDPGRYRQQARSHGAPSSAAHCLRRCRGQKTPPTESRLRPRFGRAPVGAALAATRRSQATGFDPGRYRQQARSHGAPSSAAHCPPLLSGSQDPSHKIPAPATVRAPSLWERPWPRRGACRPLPSIKAAIASKLASTAPPPAPRTALRCCRGQKTPPTKPRLQPRFGRDPCGSGLGREAALAGRCLRSKPQSRASSLRSAPSGAAHCLRRCRGQKTPPTESRLRPRFGCDPCGSGLGRDAALAGRCLRSRP